MVRQRRGKRFPPIGGKRSTTKAKPSSKPARSLARSRATSRRPSPQTAGLDLAGTCFPSRARGTGWLIAELPRGKRGPKTGELGDTDVTKFLNTSGVEKRTAMRWQSLFTYITDTAFDEAIESVKADDEDIAALPGVDRSTVSIWLTTNVNVHKGSNPLAHAFCAPLRRERHQRSVSHSQNANTPSASP